jgi:nitrite reductase/ring-hydroxylating ferredoxin subunit/DMSO/TMAO reductase YedYZ heme-binding membrane subunit
MSTGLRAVQWNNKKLVYDAVVLACVVIFISAFLTVGAWIEPPKDLPEAIDLRIRATGSCAFVMLTVILAIGPLTRLDRRLLPLLYNRRHFGVMTFAVATLHVWLTLDWYITLHALPNLYDELTRWPDYGHFIGFPFKALGIVAFVVLFLMAATSHDFWLVLLTPRIWKAMHMVLYLAYGVVAMHVALGIMQDERTLVIPAMLFGAFGAVAGLHLVAGFRERDRSAAIGHEGWIKVGPPRSIPDRAAIIVAAPGGERIAVFRDGRQIGALTNLCPHQNGPLGEGRILDGCVTCPWHGYQYRLADGRAPPPFTEKLETFRVRIRSGTVEVDPRPLPPGTPAAIMCDDKSLKGTS